jgi:hypothetical protein
MISQIKSSKYLRSTIWQVETFYITSLLNRGMKRLFAGALIVFAGALLLTGCEKKTETFETASIQDYFPLQVGRTYIYRVDSTVAATFGASLLTHSYQAKDSIEGTFNDNQGRLSYRIFRYIRDVAGTQPWVYSTTFVATSTGKTLEYVDNNLRFVKLQLPIKEGTSWYGNAFIDTHNQNFAYLDKSNGWDYNYQNVDQPYSVVNKTYDSTITVAQIDDTSPSGPFNPALDVQVRTLGVEVYAKNIGLIYKELLYWNWQKNPPPAHFLSESYGIKLSLISYK